METGPGVATPKLSRGIPLESTIVARTVIVPSLAMAALWILTTTPVFPRDVVGPLSLGVAERSKTCLTRWSSADTVLRNNKGARASRAIARDFLMDYFSYRYKDPKSRIQEQVVVHRRVGD